MVSQNSGHTGNRSRKVSCECMFIKFHCSTREEYICTLSFQDFNLYWKQIIEFTLNKASKRFFDRIMNKTVLNVKNSVNREKFLSTLPLSTGHTLKFKHIIDVDI